MKKAIEMYFEKKKEFSGLYKYDNFDNVNDEMRENISKGVYISTRKSKTDINLFEKEFGYKLPNEIEEYINIFWHPYIFGYCNTEECIVLFSVLKNKNDSDDDVLYYPNSLITMAREWDKIGNIKRYIPIGWLGYSGGYVLYEIKSHKIFLENLDVEGEIEEDNPIAASLKTLIENMD